MYKKFVPAALAAFGSVSAFAEGSAVTTPEGILTEAQTGLQALLTAGIPVVATLLVAGLGIWGAFKLVRLLMKAFGFGTSR